MLTIRGASTVSAQEKLFPITEGRGYQPGRINDLRSAPFHHHLTNGVALAQALLHD
jgi:hypothetical protein